MTAEEHYKAGRLTDAVMAAYAEFGADNADSGKAAFLSDLLLFSGDWAEADRVYNNLQAENQTISNVVNMIKSLIQGETRRQIFFETGEGEPGIVGGPNPLVEAHLAAAVKAAQGDAVAAAALIAPFAEQMPIVTGFVNGTAVEGWRDLDDILAPVLEVLTFQGDYVWVPIGLVRSVIFNEPKRPRDLFWRKANLMLTDETDAEVFLPVLYAGSHRSKEDALRLGRATDWTGNEGEPIRGVGCREYLFGEETLSILQVSKFTLPSADPTGEATLPADTPSA